MKTGDKLVRKIQALCLTNFGYYSLLNHPPKLKPSNDYFSCLKNEIITFDSLFNFWGTVYKFMVPEFKCWVFNQLNEGDEKTPRMWPIYNQPFQKNPGEWKKKLFNAQENARS